MHLWPLAFYMVMTIVRASEGAAGTWQCLPWISPMLVLPSQVWRGKREHSVFQFRGAVPTLRIWYITKNKDAGVEAEEGTELIFVG